MKKLCWGLGIAAALFFALASFATPAAAQFSKLPGYVQEELKAIGPGFQKDIRTTIPATSRLFEPLLKAAPKDGVIVTKNVSYGSDAQQVIDIYQPVELKNAPILIFMHGGAYVAGAKDSGEVSGNIGYWFARQGMLAFNIEYRLAPASHWPGAVEDLSSVIQWVKAHAAQYGGDPGRIWLMGHSAGATHVATYIFDKALQPRDGPGVLGAILVSGRYRLDYDPKDPNGKNMQAYFGTDPKLYADRSAINHINDGVKLPVFLAVTEYDNPGLDVSGAEMLAALCKRDGACPRFIRQEYHNHISEMAAFNTQDELLGRQILDFMKRGR
jgi:acetyl esterase/lipase